MSEATRAVDTVTAATTAEARRVEKREEFSEDFRLGAIYMAHKTDRIASDVKASERVRRYRQVSRMRRRGRLLVALAFVAGFANIYVAGQHGWAYSGFMFWTLILAAFGFTLIIIDEYGINDSLTSSTGRGSNED